MGCVSSRIDNEERVQICKERKRAAKKLLVFRIDFASAIVSYLRALKDTGITLRQFAESEFLELESGVPPSPPLPLPPSPPLPPPIDSPDSRRPEVEGLQNGKEAQQEIIELGEDNIGTPPPPPPYSWDFGDSLESSATKYKVGNMVDDADGEDWAEAKSQFEEEDQDRVASDALGMKSLHMDEKLLMVNGHAKDMASRVMKVWRRKTLSSIVKELDDYFLKASASGKEIAVLVDMVVWNNSTHYDLKTKNGKGNNYTGLNSLTWTRSSRSLQVTKDASEVCTPDEPCKPGAHCITLETIFAKEQKLYTAVREEELLKLEHKRRSLALQKLKEDNGDIDKIEKAQNVVENLQTDIVHLHKTVNETSTSILAIIDEELQPQLIALLSGLIHMWKTMYECHKVQTLISQQMHYLTSHSMEVMEPTTENHREATMQLMSGISFLYSSFCRLSKSQRDYVEAMCTWIRLINRPIDGENQKNGCTSHINKLFEKWQLALDRLPEKVLADAIDNFLKLIRSINKKQEEECAFKKQLDKLERRLQRERSLVFEMEKKLEVSTKLGDMAASSVLSPTHPLSQKRVKVDRLKEELENEKARYFSFIEKSKAETLSDLQKSLPRLFGTLKGYSGSCAQAFESALNRTQVCDVTEDSQAEC